MLGLTAHRNHQRIDPLFFKIGVVYQRRFKAVSRKANVGDQLSMAIDFHDEEI